MPGVGSFIGSSRTSGYQGGVFNLKEQTSLIIKNQWPGVSTNGLILNLDPATPASYPGTGSNWYDLAQGMTFTSSGTQTPFGIVGGAPAFTFNGSGYWVNSTNPNALDLGGDFTLIMWLYANGMPARKTVFEKAGTSYNSYEQELAMTWETNNQISYYSRYNVYDYGYFSTLTNSTWQMAAIKVSSGKTTAARSGFYSKNGAAWAADYNSRSSTPVVPSGEIRIGTGYSGVVTQGSIGSIYAYNRLLSDADILQTYNSTKQRYGL